ncbi:MAG: tyrosine-type recombinase/integrase, partial [Janthinobacterium lividum]
MLTDIQARKAKPAEKSYKLADAGGLYLFVTRTGFKSWRMKYRFAGKEGGLVFGAYPEVSLAEARDRRDIARRALRDGFDPGLTKKQRAADTVVEFGNSFERVATEWHDLYKSKWSIIHAADVLDSLKRDVFPTLGKMPITQITVPLVLAALRSIEKRPAVETARRVRQRMSAVFVYGIASGICEADPAAVVRGVMAPLVKGRFPALTDL